MQPVPPSPRSPSAAFERTTQNVDEWYMQMVGKTVLMNVDQLTSPSAKLVAGAAAVPSRYVESKITSIPIGVGGSSVIFRAQVDSSVYDSRNYVARYKPRGTVGHAHSQAFASARHHMQYHILHQNLAHLVPLIGHNVEEKMELLHEYIPLCQIQNYDQFNKIYQNMSPQQRSSLVESLVKSLFSSCAELQECATVYGSSVSTFSEIPKPWYLVHGDLKIENLFLDSTTASLRLGDLDAVAIVQPGREPRYGTVVTTPGYAPPEFAASKSVHDKVDQYMIATTVVRLLSSKTAVLPQFWDSESVGKAMGLNPGAPVVNLLLQCRSLDPAERPTIASALQVLQRASTDLAARTFLGWMAQCTPKMSERPTLSDHGGAGDFQQAAGTFASSSPEALPGASDSTMSLMAVSIARVPAKSLDAFVTDMMQSTNRDKVLLSSVARMKELKPEVAAAAILKEFFRRVFDASDESKLLEILERASHDCRQVLTSKVAKFTMEHVKLLLDDDRNQSLLVYLGKIAIKNGDTIATSRGVDHILRSYGFGVTSAGTLAVKLLAAFNLLRINTAGIFATQM